MKTYWPAVQLGNVLHRSEETIEPRADAEYREITVRLWGRGVTERGRAIGAELSGRRYVAHAGQFIASRIDARNGAMGLVPPSLEGAVVTNDFPIFNIDAERLEPAFLDWLSRTAAFVELCKRASEGTTNRVRLQEDKFLALEIPMPSLSEQRRIVARIEDLTDEIQEAINLRHDAARQIEELLAAEERQIWPDSLLEEALPLEHLTTFLARGKQSEQGESEHFLIKTQHVQQDHCLPTLLRLAPQAAAKVQPEAVVQEGDILIACSAAGCLGRVACYRADGRTVSTDTHVAIARPDGRVVNPDYLYAYLRGAQGQYQLRSRERGDWQREKVGFRLTELNLSDLRKIPVPVPPRPEQDRIVGELNAIRVEIDTLKRLQVETAAELDALLPSILDRAFRGEL